jgi:tetratricopeptide (TPR) repeat protein
MPARRSHILLAVMILALLTLMVFWQVQSFEFVDYDDQAYVRDNINVQAGIDLESIKWAFRTTDQGFWHPLTWISLMVDHHFFGMNPGGYHWTNLLLHLAAGLFLFFAISRMTGAIWKSFFVAALFCIHPLHVESVAWIAERKDVLSGFFWMLTIWFYVLYAEKPVPLRYLSFFAAFAFGLMAKPMLVSLPFVLLLIDFWPLRRTRVFDSESSEQGRTAFSQTVWKKKLSFLVVEKLPLFLFSGVSSWMVFYTENKAGALATADAISFGNRVFNAANTYVAYISKTFFPTKLAVFYPYSFDHNPWFVALAVAFLIVVIALALVLIKRAPYIAVGLFWFLGTLVPVIGLIQVGSHAMADRYTYLPLVGLFIVLVWGLADMFKNLRKSKMIFAIAGSMALIVLSIAAHKQVDVWRNTETLFRHALTVTGEGNYIAHNGLGQIMWSRGHLDEALYHFRAAFKARPDFELAINNAAIVLVGQGKEKEALDYFYRAIRITPEFSKAYYGIGVILKKHGDLRGAEGHFRKAVSIDPAEGAYHYWLAGVLLNQGKIKEAEKHFILFLRLQKGSIQIARDRNDAKAQSLEEAMVHYYKGVVYVDAGHFNEAIVQYREAITLQPNFAFLYNNLGVALAEAGHIADAADAYREAIRLDPSHTGAHNNLGMVLLKTGRSDDAAIQFREAIRLQPDFANAHFRLARILEEKGSMAEANHHYRRAAELNPLFMRKK